MKQSTLKVKQLVNEVSSIQPDPVEQSLPVAKKAPQTLVFEAQDSLSLQCGKASITLYASGLIELRGTNILSEARELNQLVGARIDLN